MLKKNLLIYFFISFSPMAIAQSLELKDMSDNVVSNDTVYKEGTTNDYLLEIDLKISNIGTSAINVKVKKEEKSIVSGTDNYFCWKNCYAPNVFVSPDYITIEAGATNDRSFKSDYKPDQKSGDSKILYTFFNVDDTKDSVTVLVIFKVLTATSVSKVDNSIKFISKPYPIPAKEYVTIKYKMNTVGIVTLEVYNLQSKKIEERLIEQEEVEIILSSDLYKPGIYLYIFMQNGRKVDSGKIIFQ